MDPKTARALRWATWGLIIIGVILIAIGTILARVGSEALPNTRLVGSLALLAGLILLLAPGRHRPV